MLGERVIATMKISNSGELAGSMRLDGEFAQNAIQPGTAHPPGQIPIGEKPRHGGPERIGIPRGNQYSGPSIHHQIEGS